MWMISSEMTELVSTGAGTDQREHISLADTSHYGGSSCRNHPNAAADPGHLESP